MEQESDATLWLKVRSGTERAFAVFYNRHRACLFRAALRHTGNTADAEDVVAIVLGEAWRLRERTRIVDGSLLPWLLAVTRNVASNQIRSQRRYERMLARLPSPQFQEDHAEYVDAFLDGQLCRRLLAQALDSLVPGDRVVVELCLVSELPLAAAAAALIFRWEP